MSPFERVGVLLSRSEPGSRRFEPTIAPHAGGTFEVLTGVTHLGVVVSPKTAYALSAWLSWLSDQPRGTTSLGPA